MDTCSDIMPCIDISNMSCEAFNMFIKQKKRNITKKDIKRLARRAGVKRMSRNIYTAVLTELRRFLKHVLLKAMSINSRKTLMISNIIYALKLINVKYYN